MGEEASRPMGRARATPELGQVIEVTGNLTEEQKKYRRVRLVPSDTEGVALFVPAEPAEPPVPAEVLPAVARMLAGGQAWEAAELFARLRAAGMSLKPVLGEDGVLHVTVGGA